MAEEESGPETGAENNNNEVSSEVDNENDEVTKAESAPKLTVAESVVKKLQKQPSMMSRASRLSRLKKKIAKRKECRGREPWDCEATPLWRIYMRTYTENVKKREEAAIEKYGEYHEPKPPKQSPPLPAACCSDAPICQKLNVFAPREAGASSARIWESLRPADSAASSAASEPDWPALYPCTERDAVRERQVLARKAKMKALGAPPCKVDELDSPESSDDEKLLEMANLKELGHARIPRTAARRPRLLLVDRACGERVGLVEGDYVTYELAGKGGAERTYANICLRGTAGMHLGELGRKRERTWKFCLYQAIVALLTKTQFRYKYVWSANIDYMYEHAWMLFLHVGCINALKNQRFDDVLVYNYKYSVELELIQELTNVKVSPAVCFKQFERTLRKKQQCPRKEITRIKSSFGTERKRDCYRLPVHKSTRVIEEWFDELEIQYTNCIYRTTRFSLAFWQDGPFWYLYNPYRCDKCGFWNDAGAACIVKFCTRAALKRHLMILTLRAYAYEAELGKKRNEQLENGKGAVPETFAVQIFQVIYHACQIHNVKLYNRKPVRPRAALVEKKPSDPCTFDPVAHLAPKICRAGSDNDEASDKVEKPDWVREFEITWSKNTKDSGECKKEASKWHMFDVIEPRRLYVLWGRMHMSHKLPPKEKHNRQAEACYVVCCGMVSINAPEYWSADVLDAIVVCGDSYFDQRRPQQLDQQSSPNSRDCTSRDAATDEQFRIGPMLFELRAQPPVRGQLFSRGQCLWSSLEQLFRRHAFAVLSCESSCLGVFKHCAAYYALDVLSYGPPIYPRAQAGVYLLRTACLREMVKCLLLLIGTPECSEFQLKPMEILEVTSVEEESCGGKIGARDCGEDGGMAKTKCPLEDERRKAARKRGGRATERKIIDVVVCAKRPADS